VTLRDIGDRLDTERRLRASEALFESAFRSAPIGMAVQGRGGRFLQVNQALCRLLGYSEAELLRLSSQDITFPEDRGRVEVDASNGDAVSYHKRFVRKDGTVVSATTNVSMVHNDDGSPRWAIVQIEDVTDKHELVERLVHQAGHDHLTGLPNRANVMAALTNLLATSADQIAVLLCDLDDFKVVNDTLGHHWGDRVIEEVAVRLRAAVRPSDIVGRVGGDEFVVICTSVADRPDATTIAERILDALAEPMDLGGDEHPLSVSVGVAYGADADGDPNALLRNADLAMYQAKASGRAQMEIYEHRHHQRLVARADLARELRRAIDVGDLVVYYQPCLALEDGRLHGFEALVRWHHPERGPIGPGAFVQMAEETRLIGALGAHVLAGACQHLSLWRRRGVVPRDATIAVNLSGKQIAEPGLVELIAATLAEADLPSSALCLEVTESVLLDDGDQVARVLGDLRALGVSLAIDDFGTGYSSLTMLKEYPFDILKIDRRFTDGLGTDASDEAIVAAVAGMAHALDLWVIAEGIETRAQLEVLRQYGVALGQGYLFAKPMPALEVEWWITDQLPVALRGS
jgi:diguanylate cyclase (GGDEF)-like protein/PAS domain S-box-containing protein